MKSVCVCVCLLKRPPDGDVEPQREESDFSLFETADDDFLCVSLPV